MKICFAIINNNGEYFSHFNEWQGQVHANWTKSKIQTFPTFEKALEKQKQIANLTFKECAIKKLEIADV